MSGSARNAGPRGLNDCTALLVLFRACCLSYVMKRTPAPYCAKSVGVRLQYEGLDETVVDEHALRAAEVRPATAATVTSAPLKQAQASSTCLHYKVRLASNSMARLSACPTMAHYFLAHNSVWGVWCAQLLWQGCVYSVAVCSAVHVVDVPA